MSPADWLDTIGGSPPMKLPSRAARRLQAKAGSVSSRNQKPVGFSRSMVLRENAMFHGRFGSCSDAVPAAVAAVSAVCPALAAVPLEW